MLGILKILTGNLVQGPATLRFPEQAPVPPGLRGLVRMQPERCLACGMCAYVCVSAAVSGADRVTEYEWHYDPGKCTFCARCADRCPGRAIALEEAPPPSYRASGELAVTLRVPYPACPQCGKPASNFTEEWLGQAFRQVGGETREVLRLCPACRRKRTQKALKTGLEGAK